VGQKRAVADKLVDGRAKHDHDDLKAARCPSTTEAASVIVSP